MKLTRLIELLQNTLSENGDLEVGIYEPEQQLEGECRTLDGKWRMIETTGVVHRDWDDDFELGEEFYGLNYLSPLDA